MYIGRQKNRPTERKERGGGREKREREGKTHRRKVRKTEKFKEERKMCQR